MPATLSPEEVKALMSAIQDGKIGVEGRGDSGAVATYDLISQDRIIRGQMPALDAINDTIAQALAVGFTGRTRLAIKVAPAAATLLKFADLTPLLAPPAAVCVMGLGPGFGYGLAVLEPGLGEALLGAALGDRRARSPDAIPEARRELTAVEQNVLKRLLGILAEAMTAAWAPIIPFKPEPLRFEFDPRMATVAPPTEVGIISGFELTGGIEGRLQVIIPYAAVEPARALLSATRQHSSRADERAARAVMRELERVKVDVRGVLGRTRISFSRLLELEPGDVLLLDTDEESPLPVTVQGKEKLLYSPTVSGGALALKIERGLVPIVDLQGDPAHAAPAIR